MIDGASLLLYRGYVHDIVLLSLSLFLLFITVVVFCVKFMSSSCIFDCRECVGYSLLSNLSPPDSLPVSFPLSLCLSLFLSLLFSLNPFLVTYTTAYYYFALTGCV